MSEMRLVRAIIDAVNVTRLAYVRRCQSGMVKVTGAFMHLAPNGTPDIIGYMRDGSGRLVAIEVKLPGEKPNPDQIAWQEHGKANRVVCGIARSVDEAFAIVKGS